jgi:hypothetical protein
MRDRPELGMVGGWLVVRAVALSFWSGLLCGAAGASIAFVTIVFVHR